MKISGSAWVLILGALIFQACSEKETKETFATRLIDILANDDFEAFKSELIPDEHLLLEALSIRSSKTEWEKAKKQYENMQMNAPGVFKRLAWRRISNGGTAKEIDWNKVEVKEITLESESKKGLEAGKMEIFFHFEGIDCSLRLSQMMREKGGLWKIYDTPDYGCTSGPYSKNVEIK